MARFLSTSSQNTLFWTICWKTKTDKISNFFDHKPWTELFGKMPIFSTFSNRRFFSLKWLDFYLQGHRTLCFRLVCWKTKKEQTSQVWTKNHGLTPLKKCKFSTFKSMFSSLKWLVFDLESHKTLCFGLFCWKTKKDKISNFWPRTMD